MNDTLNQTGKSSGKRTLTQNAALHLCFQQIANDMVQQGIDQRTVLNDLKGFDCPITPEFIKEVWKVLQYSMYQTTSTTELTTRQVDEVLDVLTKFLGETYGYQVVFPSVAALFEKSQEY